LLSRLMSLAEAWDWRTQGTNPCVYVERFAERARSRFLNAVELGRLGGAIDALIHEGSISETAGNAVELLLLTGARLNEVLSAEWAWVDEASGILNLPDSKTGAKPVYLSDAAVAVLQRQRLKSADSLYLFPSRRDGKRIVNLRKAWVRICERAALESVRLHDLRHTAASIAVGRGATLAVVGRLLGHTQAQTTLRYAHVDTDPALHAANEIGRAVTAAMGSKLNKAFKNSALG
jgi:integrase